MADLTPRAKQVLNAISRRRERIEKAVEVERRLFAEQVEDYRRAHEAGATYDDIGEASGVSAIFVSRKVRGIRRGR